MTDGFPGTLGDVLAVIGAAVVWFWFWRLVASVLLRLAPVLVAGWSAGLASGRARAARRRRPPGAPDAADRRPTGAEDADAADRRRRDCAGRMEPVAAAMPEGGIIFGRVLAGAPIIVVRRSDGTGVVMERTTEAVPFEDGVAVIFRETVSNERKENG